jgi:diguanylate cyclase (GGDEF)-like protein
MGAPASMGQPAPPGGGGPPSTIAGGGGGGGGGPPPSTQAPSGGAQPNQLDPALVGKVAVQVAEEASHIWELDGFGDVPPEFDTVLYPLPVEPDTPEQQLAALDVVDAKNQQDAPTLLALQPPISKELATVVAPLSQSDRAALGQGRTVSIPAVTYLNALDDLATRGGRPPQSGERTIDPGKLAEYLTTQLHSGVTPTSPAPPGPSTSAVAVTSTTVAPAATVFAAPANNARDAGTSPALLLGLILVVLFVAAVAMVMILRRTPAPALAGAAAAAGAATAPVVGPSIDDLLEVSRRLAAVTSVVEVERAAVREAVGLVSATAAAFIRREGDQLLIAHQTQDALLIPEHIQQGIIGRVAETGQPVLQVSATEPAVRNLPVALAAVPIVGGGQVTSVLLLMRPSSEPFTDRDRDLLMALAPVTATALLSAGRADSLAEASLIDPLTNVGNRRRLDRELEGFLRDADGRSTGVIMVDLDHFTSVNDNHGHPAGDALLQAVSGVIRENVRPHDHVYRYGGEEFCIVLPDTSRDEAHQAAERVGEAIRSTAFEAGTSSPLRATVSMGVATSTHATAADLIGAADRALYEAKQTGRDRAVVAPD